MIIANLKALISAKGESMIGLWGASDSGKTHLINACAHFARQQGMRFQLYDGIELAQCDADDFEDLASILGFAGTVVVSGVGSEFESVINGEFATDTDWT